MWYYSALGPGIGLSVKRPSKNIKFIQNSQTESDFKSFMENNGRGQWGLKILATVEKSLCPFNSLITKRLIPGSSEW